MRYMLLKQKKGNKRIEYIRYIKRTTKRGGALYGRAALDIGGSRLRQNKGTNSPHGLFDRGDRSKSVEYSGDYVY